MIDATVHAATGPSILTWITIGAGALSVVLGLVSAFGFSLLKRTESESFRTSFPELFKTLIRRHEHTRPHD
jgi:hypothetical protein